MFVEVLLPLPVKKTFYYKVPDTLLPKIQDFVRVLVPFGKTKVYTALVIKIHNAVEVDYQIKPIIDFLDNSPVILPVHFSFWQWMAEYYLASSGEVMNAAFPAPFKLENKLQLMTNVHFSEPDLLTAKEKLVWNFIEENNVVSLEKLQQGMKTKAVHAIINRLREKDAIVIEEKLQSGYKQKFETVISLSDNYLKQEQLDEALKLLKRAPAQTDLLLEFLQLSDFFTKGKIRIKKSELLAKKKSRGSLKALIDREILEEQQINISHLDEVNVQEFPPNPLSPAQAKAFKQIKSSFTEKDITLLHGVTSSGKTEIYIHLIQETIAAGKQVLYLLPEIALTGQIINRLRRHFGKRVGVYHSKFNDNEKVDIWKKVMSDNKDDAFQIILGVRSAIFLPFRNLGLIIVDEEHENTFRQQDPAPRYHARDAAFILARYFKAKVLLGSATPSMESIFNAIVRKQFGFVVLKQRFKEIKMPEFLVVDTKKEKKKRKMKLSFTFLLHDEIQKALERNEQVILFQNRRGYAPFLSCEKCGWVAQCINCDVSLTYHKYKNKLVCHYCDHEQLLPDHCPECGGEVQLNKGIGTEKLEEEINLLFPDAKTARMDLDSMRKKHAHEELIARFENREIDILIGTQMVSKGLDFEHVSLVGIVDVDALMFFPDFRSHERAFQLITQVSGRAGRSHNQGKVVLQTSQPDSKLMKQITAYDFNGFAKEQLSERKEYSYPPYSHLIKISLRHRDWKRVEIAADKTVQKLKQVFGNRINGPAEPVISRIKNQYIREILLKIERGKSQSRAKELLLAALNDMQQQPFFKGVSFQLEVD
ncbi:MAG: primosomal protein N' [Bacteroidales bacterium]|nr:primosomal protein N' [Bacteroidales bacterium]